VTVGGSTNEVDVDQQRLAAEASAIDLGAPPPSGDQVDAGAGQAGAAPDGEPSPERIAELAAGAEPLVHGLVDLLHSNLAPNWRLVPEKHAALAKSGALALALWFPHELPPKYVALVAVAGCVWAVAQDNKNPVTGEYQPRHAPQPNPENGARAPE
jgi:hypothetical protein